MGGKYKVDWNTINIDLKNLSDPARVRLTSWLIKQRGLGDPIPRITPKVIQDAENGQSLSVSERIDQILLFLYSKTPKPGDGIDLNLDPKTDSHATPQTETYYQLLMCSESANWSDLNFMLEHLINRELIRKRSHVGDSLTYVIEIPGFERIEHLKRAAPDSDQVFVAMWFDKQLIPVFEDGFKMAIQDAGYKPLRIDIGQHFSEKICDRIISEIRRSRFVVADFSKGRKGARGSVYYEAGFAHGLGREVIFTCREEDTDDLHFDTRQYPHIVWKAPDDLRRNLADCIIARIGYGPHRDST